MANWLETVCCILDQCAISWLEKTAPFPEELGKLKDEKTSDQETIINLRNKVIEKQDESLKSVHSAVQTTVETEIKSFVCKITLLARALGLKAKGLKAKRARDDRVSCIQ